MAIISEASIPSSTQPRQGLWRARTARERRDLLWGLAFLSPWIVGFLAFTGLPIFASLYYSLTDFNIVHPEAIHFIGLQNYLNMTRDPQFWQSMGVTLRFVVIAVPLGLAVPLLFAVLVNHRRLVGANFFRTLFFMPTIIPVVAAVMVFQGVLNSQTGWINLALGALGIEGPRWLSDPTWAIPALNLIGLWYVGNAMLILLASLQGVPTELYEAAIVDGAGPITRFWRITVPVISPVIFYNVTLGIIGAFQYFVTALLVGGRNGDPQGATLFYNIHLYRQAFVFNQMGYGAALAWVLFIIVMALTAALQFFGRRFVYYAGGDM